MSSHFGDDHFIIGLIQLIATSRKPHRRRSSGDNRPESISYLVDTRSYADMQIRYDAFAIAIAMVAVSGFDFGLGLGLKNPKTPLITHHHARHYLFDRRYSALPFTRTSRDPTHNQLLPAIQHHRWIAMLMTPARRNVQSVVHPSLAL